MKIEYLAQKCPWKLVSFKLREKYLLVIGHGKCDNFNDMAVSEMVYANALETKSRFLLLDYRSLYINLNRNEAVNIVNRSEAVQPGYKVRFPRLLVLAALPQFSTATPVLGRHCDS